MKLNVQLKHMGKSRAEVTDFPIDVNPHHHTLRDLLADVVCQEVTRYNRQKQKSKQDLLEFLTEDEISAQAQEGKVRFGLIYNEKKADESKAIANALQCFEDGLVRIYINNEEVECLDTPLFLHDEDTITFVRLTFLAGRVF